MRWAVALLVAFSLALVPGPAAADTGTLCGTLQALRWPNGVAGTAGAATIDGRTYELSVAWAGNGTNRIGRAATIGSQVCLSGELAPGTTDVLTSFVIESCASCAAVAQAGVRPAGAAGLSLAGVGSGPVPLWIAAIAAAGSLIVVWAGVRRRSPGVAIRRRPLGRAPVLGRMLAVSRSHQQEAPRQHAALGDEHLDRAS